MRKNLNRLVAFLILFLSLVMPAVTALIIAERFRTASYQGPEVEVFYQMNRVPARQQIEASKGMVRKVTAYNVGDPNQTHSKPCIGAGGDNLCNLVNRGVRICAANFVPLRSKLYVDKVGECVVLDRMNPRFGNRVDLAMGRRQRDRAVKFGVQKLNVIGWD